MILPELPVSEIKNKISLYRKVFWTSVEIYGSLFYEKHGYKIRKTNNNIFYFSKTHSKRHIRY